MQYIFLKNIIDAILVNYTCPHCQNKAKEQSLTITGVGEKTLNIHIHCHVCGTQSSLNAEISPNVVQMIETQGGTLQFQDLLNSQGSIDTTMTHNQNPHAIKDEDIIKIHNNLKNVRTIEELMDQ